MPLRDRLPSYDTIAELQRARSERLVDSFTLAERGRRQGAMYLLGYFVEITLKCMFFRFFGYRNDEAIHKRSLKSAAEFAREELGIREPIEGHHNPVFWSSAFIAAREALGHPLPRELILELTLRTQRLTSNWVPSMRYASDASTPGDWHDMKQDALWLRTVYNGLTGFVGRKGN
jgi:hypothetical protein